MFPQSKRAKMNAEIVSGENENGVSSNVDGIITSGVPPSVTVALHPLVIMNISDHFTRIKAQEGAIPKGINIKHFVLIYRSSLGTHFHYFHQPSIYCSLKKYSLVQEQRTQVLKNSTIFGKISQDYQEI